MTRRVWQLLGGPGAQVPMAALAFVCALGLLLAVLLGVGIDAPIALALAALLIVNGAARLWFRRRP